ncbi:MAG TPA: hypothetical protein VF950_05705, partial [Planctomycetota bacterium]
PRRRFEIVDERASARRIPFEPAPAPAAPARRAQPAQKAQPAQRPEPVSRAAAPAAPWISPARRPADPAGVHEEAPDLHVDLARVARPVELRLTEPPSPETAPAWPDLPVRPTDDDEPWRDGPRDAERRRRLDLEQRGIPWSE